MMTSKIYIIKLTEEQKHLFDNWLQSREEELIAQLDKIKALRNLTSEETKSNNLPPKQSNNVIKSQSFSAKTLNAFNHLGTALTSVQIIDWLSENDEQLKNKNRRYITKAVTSKLSFLVDRGRLEKKVIDGKNVYSLKTPGGSLL
jgi:hypothetical protein